MIDEVMMVVYQDVPDPSGNGSAYMENAGIFLPPDAVCSDPEGE